MIIVDKVIKENGELSMTRKHSFEVDNHDQLEKERAKLEKHYGCKVYFIRKEKDEVIKKPGGTTPPD